jgi:hypothetical protein
MPRDFINDEIPTNLSIGEAIEWLNHLKSYGNYGRFLKEASNPKIEEQISKLKALHPNVEREAELAREERLREKEDFFRSRGKEK